MARVPGILPTQDIQGPIGQTQATQEDFAPDWRSVLRTEQGSQEVMGDYSRAAIAHAKSTGAVADGVNTVADALQSRQELLEGSDAVAQMTTANKNLTIELARRRQQADRDGVGISTFANDFLTYANSTLAPYANNYTTDKAKLLVQRQTAQIQADLASQAYDDQSLLVGQKIGRDNEQNVKDAGQTLAVSPDKWSSASASVDAMVQHYKDAGIFDQGKLDKLRDENMHELAVSAKDGWVKNSPKYAEKIAKGDIKLDDKDNFLKHLSGPERAAMEGEAHRMVNMRFEEEQRQKRVVDEKKAEDARNFESDTHHALLAGDPNALANAQKNYLTEGGKGLLDAPAQRRIEDDARNYTLRGNEDPPENQGVKSKLIADIGDPKSIDPARMAQNRISVMEAWSKRQINRGTLGELDAVMSAKNVYGDPNFRALISDFKSQAQQHSLGLPNQDDVVKKAVNDYTLDILPDIRKMIAAGKTPEEIYNSEKSPFYGKRMENFFPDFRQASQDKLKEATAPSVAPTPFGFQGTPDQLLIEGTTRAGRLLKDAAKSFVEGLGRQAEGLFGDEATSLPDNKKVPLPLSPGKGINLKMPVPEYPDDSDPMQMTKRAGETDAQWQKRVIKTIEGLTKDSKK